MADPAPDPPLDPRDELEDTVRRSDPDRWLAARFVADAALRADLIALYAFDHVIARAPAQVSEPLMGEIRLTWWAETVDEIYAGRPARSHPAALALAEAVRRRGVAQEPLNQLIEARMGDLQPAPPFADAGAAQAYADATAGALMQAAAQLLGAEDGLDAARLAGRAYGLAAMERRRATGGKTRLPEGLEARRLVAESLRAAQPGLRALPLSAFPAVAYAALAPRYARGARVTTLEKQLRLVWATASGRV